MYEAPSIGLGMWWVLSNCQLSPGQSAGGLGALPVDVAQLVQRVDGQHHLSQVELSQLGWEAVLKAAQQSEEVPTSIVVHHQVLEGGGRGGGQESDGEGRGVPVPGPCLLPTSPWF